MITIFRCCIASLSAANKPFPFATRKLLYDHVCCIHFYCIVAWKEKKDGLLDRVLTGWIRNKKKKSIISHLSWRKAYYAHITHLYGHAHTCEHKKFCWKECNFFSSYLPARLELFFVVISVLYRIPNIFSNRVYTIDNTFFWFMSFAEIFDEVEVYPKKETRKKSSFINCVSWKSMWRYFARTNKYQSVIESMYNFFQRKGCCSIEKRKHLSNLFRSIR